MNRRTASIILAAGNGTRMRAPDRHKVTLPIDGEPVVARAIRMYRDSGINRHIVVVGVLAEQVREAVLHAAPEVDFAVQSEQLGTAHAARVGADVLKAEGFAGDVLVVAGDKVMEAAAIDRLIASFRKADCAMAFVVGRATDFPNAGRVLLDDGRPIAVVEVADIARARLLRDFRVLTAESPLQADQALRLALKAFPTESKAAKALGPLWNALTNGVALTADSLPPADQSALRAESAALANLSVYLFRAPALYAALDAIGADNAQGEQYLTDAVAFLAGRGDAVVAVEVSDPNEVMAFNTPDEYAEVRRRFERTVEPLNGGKLARDGFERRFASRPTLVARAPGRLNLMGRHIDHQGGVSNLIAIDRSLHLAVSPRSDAVFHLSSVDAAFPDREFRVNPPASAADWLAYINGPAVRELTAEARGDWSLYVRAAVERLQFEAARPLRGMNIVAKGTIPIAAGLSSSSALVVAAAEAILALNDLRIGRDRLVELCGEAEWFVGTRGGAGDHAAMILAREGCVTQVGYFPFRVIDSAPLPAGHTFMVFNSGIPARKTAEVKATFNARVACYHVGRELLRLACPNAPITHLRDVTPSGLQMDYPSFIRLLGRLPERLTVADARAAVPAEVADTYLSQLPDDEVLPIRGVVIFGLAECARAAKCLDLLRAGDVATFGRWMTISHNGDRATPAAYAGAEMERWFEAANRGDPATALELQPGAYACSVPAIDRMVDIALAVPGVLGAQLSGAGLGGCMMVFAEDASLDHLEDAMRRHYYEPNGVSPDIIRCRATAGSGTW
ncbi:MAG TPA: NTP transferase domain-containing protein [Armatimonadota bacterium]